MDNTLNSFTYSFFKGQDPSLDPERNRAPGLNPVQMIADDHDQDLHQNPAQSEFFPLFLL